MKVLKAWLAFLSGLALGAVLSSVFGPEVGFPLMSVAVLLLIILFWVFREPLIYIPLGRFYDRLCSDDEDSSKNKKSED